MAIYLGENKVSTYLKETTVETGQFTLSEKTITPTGELLEVFPNTNEFFSKVTILGDTNLKPQNIRQGISIYGVEGTLTATAAPVLYSNYIVNPSVGTQTISVPNGYDGFESIIVNPVTADIDQDIIPSNIRSGVNILGVTGSYSGESLNLNSHSISSNGTYDASDFGLDGFTSVYVAVPNTGITPEDLEAQGYVIPFGTKEILENGTFPVAGWDKVKVEVPVPDGYMPIPEDNLDILVNTEGVREYNVRNYGTATINFQVPSTYVQPSGTKTINFNGTNIPVDTYKWVNVDVAAAKQEQQKAVTPTRSTQVITADDPSIQALSSVTVYPIPSEYTIPAGSDTFKKNGTYNVKNLEYITIDVKEEIHKYVFSQTQPTDATEGTIWFKPIE
jgi:hypothetical protein